MILGGCMTCWAEAAGGEDDDMTSDSNEMGLGR